MINEVFDFLSFILSKICYVQINSVISLTILSILFISIFFKGITLVPERQIWVVESLGSYSRSLTHGVHFIMPCISSIVYKHDLKQVYIDLPEQLCLTKDKIQLKINAILCIRVVNAISASYILENPYHSIVETAKAYTSR